MEPTYNINDVVIVMKKNDYNVGEIISYINKDEIITHRIIQKYYKNNEKIFISKGDNNDVEDNIDIKEGQILGKAILHIKGAGKIVNFIQNKKGFISSISLIIICFILKNQIDSKKEKRKIKRKKYEIKKKRDKYVD